MTFLFSVLTLLALLAVTLVAQSTGMMVSNYFALLGALAFYVVWQARKQGSFQPTKNKRSAA
ncbi:hypothetical protein [Reinekea thalattae]|uniref:Uncharacterized protein n=1 Tax=Reinekea thalattae TaxID=2593301 RepID=A0A5C8Z2B9_9GAMM|nr:hypothetical protein [Reinekea thalattae]TXR51399.1 hypothetical protein FME95_12795 [Reinekea thalattae]